MADIPVRANYTAANNPELVLSANNEKYWGEVPGNFNSTWDTTVEIEQFAYLNGSMLIEPTGKKVFNMSPVYKMKFAEYSTLTLPAENGTTT